jgi:hypothetical protein
MKLLLLSLPVLLMVMGCVTKSQLRRETEAAYLAGQRSVLQKQASNSVTVLGTVQNPNVPWVVGLTLAQAIATANYIERTEPKSITIVRQGESANVDPKDLLNGTPIPLEPGDVIEIR